MSTLVKLHSVSAVYCGVLVCLNWFRSVNYARQYGLLSESNAPVMLAYLLSWLILIVLGFRALQLTRRHLERGAQVRAGRWIQSWSVLIYTLPLLWHRISTSSWREADGAIATATGGYGHELSSYVFLLAIANLLLLQIVVRLSPE